MKILKNKVLHAKQAGKGLDCKWYTFKQGDMVPAELEDLVMLHGGELDDEKVVERSKLVKKKTAKKAGKKKK